MTIARGPAQLYDIGSSKDPSRLYRVVLAYDESVGDTCTCPAFFYRTSKAQNGDCKHIGEARYQDSLVDEAPVGFTPGVATDRKDIVLLLEDAFTSGMRLGRKFGAVYGKDDR